MQSPIVAPWLTLFGDSPVYIRDVLATRDSLLEAAINGFLPNPDPRTFAAYLSLVEHRPLRNGRGSYRFVRAGNRRWRLVEVDPHYNPLHPRLTA